MQRCLLKRSIKVPIKTKVCHKLSSPVNQGPSAVNKERRLQYSRVVNVLFKSKNAAPPGIDDEIVFVTE